MPIHSDPYAILFGALLFLLGVAAVLAVLLKRHGDLAWSLAAVFGTSACVWLGLLGFDLARLYAADIRPLTVDVRWILFPAAVILLASGTVVLGVYGGHAGRSHAWEYRLAVRLILLTVAALFLGVLLQPLFA